MDIYAVRQRTLNERISIYDIPLRVTFYARMSTTMDAQLNSIGNQKVYFEDFIKKNENWTYVPGYSAEIRGDSADNREQFMQMVEEARMGKFDLILTKEISRFARDTLDSIFYTRLLYNE